MSFARASRPVTASTSKPKKKAQGSGNVPNAPGRLSTAKLDRKTPDAFGVSTRKKQSPFVEAYNARAIPCVLCHGSVKHKLEWSTPPEYLDSYDPVLCLLADGLVETNHPYYFIARIGFKEMLEAPNGGHKAAPLAQRLANAVRAALMSNTPEVYDAGLTALAQLGTAIGASLTPHLKLVIGQLAKNMSKRSLNERITSVLNVLEAECGPDCFRLIKAKIPVYCSIHIGSAPSEQ
eukprot:m.477530 g.477530  ORF g.477530 m.477530 type:complete len:235 (-) comp21688_c1_seq11:413-1117(-)